MTGLMHGTVILAMFVALAGMIATQVPEGLGPSLDLMLSFK